MSGKNKTRLLILKQRQKVQPGLDARTISQNNGRFAEYLISLIIIIKYSIAWNSVNEKGTAASPPLARDKERRWWWKWGLGEWGWGALMHFKNLKQRLSAQRHTWHFHSCCIYWRSCDPTSTVARRKYNTAMGGGVWRRRRGETKKENQCHRFSGLWKR